jgi:hypothetical protein
MVIEWFASKEVSSTSINLIQKRILKKIEIKIITPPMTGTLRRWILRSSPGSSTRRFILATFIRVGSPKRVIKKVDKATMKSMNV